MHHNRTKKKHVKYTLTFTFSRSFHTHHVNCLVLPGLDVRLWWQCNTWLEDLIYQFSKPSDDATKPSIGPLLKPIYIKKFEIRCPSIEILHIKQSEKKLIPKQDIETLPRMTTFDMSTCPSETISTKSTVVGIEDTQHKAKKLTEDQSFPAIDEDEDEDDFSHLYQLLGIRIRGHQLNMETTIAKLSQLESSQQKMNENEEQTSESEEKWILLGKDVKLEKPIIHLIVPQFIDETESDSTQFFHISPFKEENCYGPFVNVKFADAKSIGFSDKGYRKLNDILI